MKISIVTATYNRSNLLERLYNSILLNLKSKIIAEWIIIDDGSEDNTKQVVDKFIKENKLEIKYFKQENQGKMSALNNAMKYIEGEILIECDSDDWLTDNAFKIIEREYNNVKNNDNLYALCFLKYDSNGNNMGKDFINTETTMFDLYFKEKEDGEKALVFITPIRKMYKHILEHKEKFITEARMYHKMDLKYKIKCINIPIIIAEYQNGGYTKNILSLFKKNPYGYYEYFKEIFEHDMKGITTKKRLYIIKHYILFSYLTKQFNSKNVKGFLNKFLYFLLLIPGILKTKIKIGKSI